MTDQRAELYFTLYVICSDYHSGQWSRGYRILSRLWRMGMNLTDSCFTDIRDGDLYHELVQRYKNKL